MHPVKKKRILHAGVDLAAPYGTPVYASGSGKVVEARYSSSYGWYIEIRHAGGFSTLYAHLSKLHVRKGSDVRIGRHIGNVGHTGIATGNHLHFEVWENGQRMDAVDLFSQGRKDIYGGAVKAGAFKRLDNGCTFRLCYFPDH